MFMWVRAGRHSSVFIDFVTLDKIWVIKLIDDFANIRGDSNGMYVKAVQTK